MTVYMFVGPGTSVSYQDHEVGLVGSLAPRVTWLGIGVSLHLDLQAKVNAILHSVGRTKSGSALGDASSNLKRFNLH